MVSWGELKIENGVYVYTNKGELIKPEEWDTSRNEEAVGVAVITDNTRMCIGKSGRNRGIAWSNALYGTDVPEIANAGTSGTDDYRGQYNTNIIRQRASSENSSNNAAHWCCAQTITVNGGTVHGYLPAIGELYDAYQNKSAVDSAMSKIGGTAILSGWHWSSSESNYSTADHARVLHWNDGGIDYNRKDYDVRYAFPCFPID